MCKCVLRLDWKVIEFTDVIVVPLYLFYLIQKFWCDCEVPPWPQEGNHVLFLYDQFSGMCSNMMLTKPLLEGSSTADGEIC